MKDHPVYFVPYLDGDWLGFGPLDPELDYGVLPPNQEEICRNLETAVGFWKTHTGGKMVFGAHSGTYCREVFYREPVLSHYRSLIANGGEIAVHPHEERVRSGHFIEDLEHMRFVISWKRKVLVAAGITPTTLRIPYNGYVPGLTRIAEENDLLVDLSGAPGFFNEFWKADWRGAPLSAYFLDYEDQRIGGGGAGSRSRVLEVPLGCDGRGSTAGNYLYNEQITYDELVRVWDAIATRAQTHGPQIVYYLVHLHSMADPELTDRCSRLLEYAQRHGGVPVTPSEAYARYRDLRSRGALAATA